MVKILINIISFYVVAYLIPGVTISGWRPLLVISVVWGILSFVVKPVLILLTLPINIVTLGLFTFVINAFLLMGAARFVSGFAVKDFATALLAAIALAIINMFLSRLK